MSVEISFRKVTFSYDDVRLSVLSASLFGSTALASEGEKLANLVLLAIAGGARVRGALSITEGGAHLAAQARAFVLRRLPGELRVDEWFRLAGDMRGEAANAFERLSRFGLSHLVRERLSKLGPAVHQALSWAEALTSTRVRLIVGIDPFTEVASFARVPLREALATTDKTVLASVPMLTLPEVAGYVHAVVTREGIFKISRGAFFRPPSGLRMRMPRPLAFLEVLLRGQSDTDATVHADGTLSVRSSNPDLLSKVQQAIVRTGSTVFELRAEEET